LPHGSAGRELVRFAATWLSGGFLGKHLVGYSAGDAARRHLIGIARSHPPHGSAGRALVGVARQDPARGSVHRQLLGVHGDAAQVIADGVVFGSDRRHTPWQSVHGQLIGIARCRSR
jgi:hypothetical protein